MSRPDVRHAHYLEPGVCTRCDHYIYIHARGTCSCGCYRDDCMGNTGRLDD